MHTIQIEEKHHALSTLMRQYGSVAVAYSGGVDSSLLCRLAHDELGDNAVAITVLSPFLSRQEKDDAKRIAAEVGIRHILLPAEQPSQAVLSNNADRCYHCKHRNFTRIKETARELGLRVVVDGSNVDDLADYRPGARAVTELSVESPFQALGMNKTDIRELSRFLGLSSADKPAYACLASRIPYGSAITEGKIQAIEEAEEYLRGFGLRQFRVRHHGDIARIEVAPEERTTLFDTRILDDVSDRLRALGFLYVCMELSGYRSGSLNRQLPRAKAQSDSKGRS